MRCCCGRLVLSSSRISPLGILKITLIRRWISMKNSLTSTILEKTFQIKNRISIRKDLTCSFDRVSDLLIESPQKLP